ncbi:MAG TPA: hypothetical protein VGZ00_06990 [Candidatus Baltobacteraceae bacterium]|nr:hypothetical protein [Candidatus Baltobacteraceae bacterium]
MLSGYFVRDGDGVSRPVDEVQNPRIHGLYLVHTRKIYLECTSAATVAHELGHAYDHVLGIMEYGTDGCRSPFDPKFIECWQGGEFVSEFSKRDELELFAEGCRVFSNIHQEFDNPDSLDWQSVRGSDLEKYAPGVFDYIKRADIALELKFGTLRDNPSISKEPSSSVPGPTYEEWRFAPPPVYGGNSPQCLARLSEKARREVQKRVRSTSPVISDHIYIPANPCSPEYRVFALNSSMLIPPENLKLNRVAVPSFSRKVSPTQSQRDAIEKMGSVFPSGYEMTSIIPSDLLSVDVPMLVNDFLNGFNRSAKIAVSQQMLQDMSDKRNQSRQPIVGSRQRHVPEKRSRGTRRTAGGTPSGRADHIPAPPSPSLLE